MTNVVYARRAMLVDPTEEEEELARKLVDDAIRHLRGALTSEEYEAITFYLVEEILCTPAGRQLLRAAQEDPRVERSDEVARGVVQQMLKKGRSAG